MNKTASDITDEMIQSQRRFEELFMSVESRFASFQEQMGRLSSDQFAIYDEKSRPSGLRKTTNPDNSLAHSTTWPRSDLGFPSDQKPQQSYTLFNKLYQE